VDQKEKLHSTYYGVHDTASTYEQVLLHQVASGSKSMEQHWINQEGPSLLTAVSVFVLVPIIFVCYVGKHRNHPCCNDDFCIRSRQP
jgi:hypothetical protein